MRYVRDRSRDFVSGPLASLHRGMVTAVEHFGETNHDRQTVEVTLQPAQETAMTEKASDPRLDLTIDDLRTLCAAVAIALPTINPVDRVRYQELAAKLAAILIHAQQIDDLWRAARKDASPLA
jgi:hypothetical protein